MMFPTLVVSAFLAASSLVQASPLVPRANDDTFTAKFLDDLDKCSLSILKGVYENCFKSDPCRSNTEAVLKYGVITLLAPENKAFGSDNSIGSDPESILAYNTIMGDVDKGFATGNSSVTRRGPNQTRSIGTSGFSSPGLGSRRRGFGQIDSNQVQVVDNNNPTTRKRANTGLIKIGRTVGSATVVDRCPSKLNMKILIVDTVLTLPSTVSDGLCKPLIESTPNGFTKFGGALQKADLLDKVDNGKRITIFAPVDEACNDDLSGDTLKNHFFFGDVVYSPEFDKTSEATAESGKKLTFYNENGVNYVCCGNDKAMVLRSDVATNNGVLHVIDRPLKCDY